jgi:hypothetical protein
MVRLASVLLALSLLTSAATAYAEWESETATTCSQNAWTLTGLGVVGVAGPTTVATRSANSGRSRSIRCSGSSRRRRFPVQSSMTGRWDSAYEPGGRVERRGSRDVCVHPVGWW